MHSIRIFGHYMRLPLLLLALAEALIFAFCFILSHHLRWELMEREEFLDLYPLLGYAIVVSLTFVLSMGSMGLYEASAREGLNGLLIRILLSLGLGSIALAVLGFLFPTLDLWRSILGLTVATSFIGVAGLRLGVYYFKPWIFRRRVLVFGDSAVMDDIIQAELNEILIVGIVPASQPSSMGTSHPKPMIPHDQPLLHIALAQQADEILIAVKDRRGSLPMEELLDCRMSGILVLEPQSFFERELGMVKLNLLTPSWLLHAEGFRHGSVTHLVKRGGDVTVALLFLLLFSPIMLLTALAIGVESRSFHHIFYRQIRVGINGLPFKVLKFRSMRLDAEADGRARWATKHDSRITRVGSFIRKARIDELPQIINVLKGEMSFVGPRPERPEFVAELARKNPFYAARSRIRPGLTGWAQLRYPYGSTEDDALRKLEYDLYYLKNQSTFLDFLILLQTVEVVLFGKGAV